MIHCCTYRHIITDLHIVLYKPSRNTTTTACEALQHSREGYNRIKRNNYRSHRPYTIIIHSCEISQNVGPLLLPCGQCVCRYTVRWQAAPADIAYAAAPQRGLWMFFMHVISKNSAMFDLLQPLSKFTKAFAAAGICHSNQV